MMKMKMLLSLFFAIASCNFSGPDSPRGSCNTGCNAASAYDNKLSGTLFIDDLVNGEDISSADTGIAGVTVNLVCGGSTYTAVTDANGDYEFVGMPPGLCTISIDPSTLPSNLSHVYDEDNNLDNIYDVQMTASGDFPGNDFGYTPPVTATFKFTHDENGLPATCPMDFSGRTFNLTANGGGSAEILADASALELRLEALTGYNWSYDTIKCEYTTTAIGAVDDEAPLARENCTPLPTMVYSLDDFQTFTLSGVTTSDGSSDWLVNLVNTSVLEDQSTGAVTPVGTIVDSYASGSFAGGSEQSLGATINLLAGEYAVKFVGAACSHNESITVAPIEPFAYLDTATESAPYTCSETSGSVNPDGNLEVYSRPTVPASGVYDQMIQASIDGGTTWLDPDSFSGGVAWYGTSPATSGNKIFAVSPQAGLMIQNCLSVAGTGTSTKCDTKTVPDPSVNVDAAGGTITLANQVTESNQCHDPNQDDYNLILTAYNAQGLEVESYSAPSFNPFTGMVDLSSAPTQIQAMVGHGGSGAALSYNPSAGTTATQVEAILEIVHKYDCQGTDRDTTLSWQADSLAYTLDLAQAVPSGSGIQINDSYFSPAITDYLVHVYDFNNNSVGVFGAGSMYVAGTHLPTQPISGIQSSTPLSYQAGGPYHLVLETPTGSIPLGKVCLDEWDMCGKVVEIKYAGKVTGSGFTYQIPVDADQTSIQYKFETLFVADRFTVKYEGATLHDSGQITTQPSPPNTAIYQGSFPLTYNNDSFVTVEIIPSAGLDPTVDTIFDLTLGCCLPSGGCDLPERDPYVINYQYGITPTECTARYSIGSPYTSYSGHISSCFIKELSDFEGDACLSSVSSASQSRIGRGWAPTSSNSTTNNCWLLGDQTERDVAGVTNIANKVCVPFTNAATYATGKTYFENLASLVDSYNAANAPNKATSILVRAQDDLCPVDDISAKETHYLYVSSAIMELTPLTNTICFDYELADADNVDVNPCRENTFDKVLYADRMETYLKSTMRSSYQHIRRGKNNFSSGGRVDLGGDWCLNYSNVGIASSPCTNQGQQDYYLKIDKLDLTSWIFGKGTCAAQVDVLNTSSADGFFPGNPNTSSELVNSSGNWTELHCNNTTKYSRSHFRIVNSDGLTVQNVGWGTDTCDLSYYGGGTAELFSDTNDFAARLASLTGLSTGAYEPQTIVWAWPLGPYLPPITCK